MSSASSRRSSLVSDESNDGDEYRVRPAVEVPPQKMKLSVIDQCEVRVWSSYVLCFPISKTTTKWETFDVLHQGLSRTLVQFPFLAGRISYEDPHRSILQVVLGDDPYVRLGYRDLSDVGVSYASLKERHFPPSMLEAMDIAPAPEPYPVEGCPVFIAQVNFLKDGVLVFFAHAHQVADATGTGSILQTWSQHVSEIGRGHALTTSCRLREASMNRSRLNHGINDCAVPSSAWPFTKEGQKGKNVNRKKTVAQDTPCLSKRSIVWRISEKQLRILKKEAYPPDDGRSRWISTMDALTALFWRQITQVRAKLGHGKVDRTTLFFILNARTRLSPPLRDDGVLNATCKMFASMDPTDFHMDLSTSLQQASFQIRKVIDTFSSDRYDRYIGYLQSAERLSDITLKERLQGGPDIVATDHSRLDLYSHNWSHLGKIDCVRKMWWSREKPESQFTVMAHLPDGGLEIMTDVEPEANELLKKDQELKQFAEFLCE